MPKRKADAEKQGTAEPGFENSLERLELIVREMESGDLGLEKLMQHFEEGQALAKFCGSKLNEVERKIEVLVKKGDEVTTEPFEGEPAETDVAEEDEDEDGDDAPGADAKKYPF